MGKKRVTMQRAWKSIQAKGPAWSEAPEGREPGRCEKWKEPGVGGRCAQVAVE